MASNAPFPLAAAAGGAPLLLRQLFDAETGTFTYLLADVASRQGVLIDSVYEQHPSARRPRERKLEVAPGHRLRHCPGRRRRGRERDPAPGHTDGCLSVVIDDHSLAFTGDALLVRDCGRCDFQ